MTVEFDGGIAQVNGEGYSMLFDVDRLITTQISLKEIRLKLGLSTKVDLRELDGILSRDDARALIPEVIDEQIHTYIQPKRVGRSLVTIMKVTEGNPAFFRETGFEASFVSEAGEIPIAHAEWKKFTVEIKKIGVRCVITREMKEDARWDMMRRAILQAGLAMARKEDLMIITCLNDGVPNNLAIDGDGVGGFGHQVPNHRYKMGSAASGNLLTFRAIAKAYTALAIEGIAPDTMLIHPFQMYDLLTMEGDFIGATEKAYLTLPEALKSSMTNGTIGTIMGMRVVQSHNQTPGQCVLFDSAQYAVLAEKAPVGIDEYEDYIHQLSGIVLSQRCYPAAIMRDAAVMLTAGREKLLTLAD